MKDLAQRIGLQVRPRRADTIDLRVVKGVSPCAAGGYSVEAILVMPEAKGLDRIAEILKTVGEVRPIEDFGVVMVDAKEGTAKVFAGGQISAVGKKPEDATAMFDRVARAVLSGNLCTRCGICVRTCPTGAITMRDFIEVDDAKCDQCGKCAESCVVAHYFDKLAGGEPSTSTATRISKRA